MSNEKTVVVTGPAAAPDRVKILRERYNTLVRAAKEVLKRNVDFGVVPGTDKPVLLKAGAEKLATLFNLRPHFILEEKVEDWEKGFFYYRYRCELRAPDGTFVGDAEGSANSKEKKYRYRYVPEFKATEQEKARAVRKETVRAKNGNLYVRLVLENPDPYDLVNTLQKMAQKRALVGAVLVATGASEFFSQGVDDLEEIGTDNSDGDGGTPQSSSFGPRPWSAAEVVRALQEAAANWDGKAVSAGLFNAALGLMTEAGDRHAFLKQAFGVESSRDLTGGQKSALVQWVKPEKACQTCPWTSKNPHLTKELNRVVETAIEEK